MLNVESTGSVLRVTLNRPEVRNAFNDELIERLSQVFQNLEPNVRAVVLAGEGASFCAGGDLEWMRKAAKYTEQENFEDAMRLSRLFTSIAECRAVIIARVHGACFGGGCGLVAAADVAVAADDTKFAFSEVRLGLIPATISPFVITRIGRGHSRALFATGETFDAAHALRIGLAHESVPADSLDEAVGRKLKAVLSAGPLATYGAKRLVLNADLSAEECSTRLAQARAGAEGQEGITAFLEKRKPSFVEEYTA